MFFYDSSFIILIPALILSGFAQYMISSNYNKYSKVTNLNNYTGAQVARMLLDYAGLTEVPVEVVGGRLTDHYDPSKRTMRLSEDVFYGNSVAAIGVAAHETGHAIQHKEGYIPLNLRNSIVPVVNFSSQASWIIFIIGMFMGSINLIDLGIILFTAVIVFQFITLPVEFNASSRALNILENKNILYTNELKGARKVLNAAAMTYIAAALMSVAQLLRLILLSNRRRD